MVNLESMPSLAKMSFILQARSWLFLRPQQSHHLGFKGLSWQIYLIKRSRVMDNSAIMAIITGVFATAMMLYAYMTNRKFLKK
jgi:hypothetical protein